MHNLQKINVLIACDFSILRNGIRLLVEHEEEISIMGEVENVNGIFNLLQNSTPNLITINLNLEAESLDSLCKNIHSKYPDLPILVFLKDSMDISLAELIVSGVRGVIWEENSDINLVDVIRCVGRGNLFFEDPKNCRINCRMSKKICEDPKLKNYTKLLSNREIEVLKLIANGYSYKEIAKQLNISNRTVESHKNNILEKLNLRNKSELVRYAIENLKL